MRAQPAAFAVSNYWLAQVHRHNQILPSGGGSAPFEFVEGRPSIDGIACSASSTLSGDGLDPR
jgi:hypothetical protein